METGELRASRTERKLWLASFHQDATIARSNAAILLRSAPPTQQSLPLDPSDESDPTRVVGIFQRKSVGAPVIIYDAVEYQSTHC